MHLYFQRGGNKPEILTALAWTSLEPKTLNPWLVRESTTDG